MSVNEAVRNLRAFTKDSQQSFGHRLGVSLRAISNYERDRAPSSPSLYQLAKLARDVGREDLAQVFSAALSQELRDPVEPMTNEEKAWSGAILAVLRSPEASGWAQIARGILRGLEKLVQHMPDDQKLAEVLFNARYALIATAESQLGQLAGERQRNTGETYEQAYAKVLMQHPELYAQYTEERYRAAQGTMFERTMPRVPGQKRRQSK